METQLKAELCPEGPEFQLKNRRGNNSEESSSRMLHSLHHGNHSHCSNSLRIKLVNWKNVKVLILPSIKEIKDFFILFFSFIAQVGQEPTIPPDCIKPYILSQDEIALLLPHILC